MWSVFKFTSFAAWQASQEWGWSTSRRLRPTQILLLFQSLDGGNQGFVATGDDTLQLGIALLDHSLQFSRLFLEVFSGLVVQ
jgi:hypothetical protein